MLKRLTVAAVAVSLAAGGLLLLYAVLLNRHAKRVLQNVFELSQQQPPPSLSDLKRRFGKELTPMPGCPGVIAGTSRYAGVLHPGSAGLEHSSYDRLAVRLTGPAAMSDSLPIRLFSFRRIAKTS